MISGRWPECSACSGAAESDIADVIVAMVPGWTTLLLWLDAMRRIPRPSRRPSALPLGPGGACCRIESRIVTLPAVYSSDAGPTWSLSRRSTAYPCTTRWKGCRPRNSPGWSASRRMANCMWVDSSRALTAPKYCSPRTTTPPGTIGLGGSSISLYLGTTPGGFQMVGRLAVPIYEPGRPCPRSATTRPCSVLATGSCFRPSTRTP